MKISNKSLEEQFSTFCKKNSPKDIETAINLFSIFGGTDIKIDTQTPITKLIEKHILDEYRYLRNDISELTSGDTIFHAVLTGIATGDRRTNSAFKRASVSYEDGIDSIDELCKKKVLKAESPMRHLTNIFEEYDVSDKLLFSAPFMRFWFAFVSPIFQGIKKGEYKEFFTKFENNKAEFPNLIFEELSQIFLKKIFVDDPIVEIGRYWDDEIELDLLAKTKSGKIIVGSCKYINSKLKKSELTKLKEYSELLDIEPDMFVIFAKNGYTSELKSLKSDSIKLFTAKSLKPLMGI